MCVVRRLEALQCAVDEAEMSMNLDPKVLVVLQQREPRRARCPACLARAKEAANEAKAAAAITCACGCKQIEAAAAAGLGLGDETPRQLAFKPVRPRHGVDVPGELAAIGRKVECIQKAAESTHALCQDIAANAGDFVGLPSTHSEASNDKTL